MPRFAVIDVGTNSLKLHVAERPEGGGWTALQDLSEVTRLGEGLEATGGRFTPAAVERTLAAFCRLVSEARRWNPVAVVAVGTMGLRTASNRDDLIAAARTASGIGIEVISGEEESRLAYLAVQATTRTPDGALTVFDTGGGSTQFTFGRGPCITHRFSLNVGAVRVTEASGLGSEVSADAIQRVLASLDREFERLDALPPPDAVVGLGGSVTNLTSVMHGLAHYDPGIVGGSVLTRSEIDRQIDLYRSLPTAERRQIRGLQPQRAEMILAGACIVRTILGKLRRDSLTVSDRGLRHGVLVDRFGP